MRLHGAALAVSILLIGDSAHTAPGEDGLGRSTAQQERQRSDTPEVLATERIGQIDASQDQLPEFPIAMRPNTLAALVDTLAGRSVRLLDVRVVGVFEPRVFLVESQSALRPIRFRNRVLVFIEAGALRVDPGLLVASTVTASGVARTLLGMQVSGEVPWPSVLTRDAVRRLDIRAALLATSVRTPEGIDLLQRSSTSLRLGHSSSPNR
jgi:hypothetical protein